MKVEVSGYYYLGEAVDVLDVLDHPVQQVDVGYRGFVSYWRDVYADYMDKTLIVVDLGAVNVLMDEFDVSLG